MATIKELKTHINNNYKDEDHCAWHLWIAQDVLNQAREMGTTISEEEADEIIDNIHQHVDSLLGITWETLRCSIDDCIYRRLTNENRSKEGE